MPALDSSKPSFPQPIFTPLCSVFRQHLKGLSLRYTIERADILAAVMNEEDLFDADSLLIRLRNEGKDVSKATIYRTLRLLQDAGIIMPFMLLGAQVTHYQLAYGRDPADYLVCLQSGRIERIDSDAVAQMRDMLAKERGWSVAGHRFVIYGAAPEDANDAKRDASSH